MSEINKVMRAVARRMGRWYRMTSGVMGRPIKHYHMVGVGLLLQDIWKAAR